MAASSDIATAADRTLVIERIVDAPRALVFKLWAQPEHVVRWWGPQGFTLPACEMDFREGGAFYFLMRSPEGNDHHLRGVYREIVEPERLVCTWAWEDADGWLGHETLLTVTFAEHGGKTKLTLHHAAFDSLAARDDHEGGWTTCLERLAAYVAQV